MSKVFGYKITIEQIGEERRTRGKVWERGAGATSEDPDAYGYTPEIERVVEFDRKIFEQTVEELDVVAVIAAVNGRIVERQHIEVAPPLEVTIEPLEPLEPKEPLGTLMPSRHRNLNKGRPGRPDVDRSPDEEQQP